MAHQDVDSAASGQGAEQTPKRWPPQPLPVWPYVIHRGPRPDQIKAEMIAEEHQKAPIPPSAPAQGPAESQPQAGAAGQAPASTNPALAAPSSSVALPAAPQPSGALPGQTERPQGLPASVPPPEATPMPPVTQAPAMAPEAPAAPAESTPAEAPAATEPPAAKKTGRHRRADEQPVSGGQIRAARLAHGWTQAQLAEMVQLSRPFIALVEQGRRILAPQDLARVRQALGI